MDCSTIESHENVGNAIETTIGPSDCSSDAEYYDCAVLENLPGSLGMNVNGVYKNTGECLNGKPIYNYCVC